MAIAPSLHARLKDGTVVNDMAGLDDSFDSRNDFAGRLAKLCKIDTSGNRWTKVGNFEPTGAASPTKAKPSAQSAKAASRRKRFPARM
jgi:hypothetical protein